MTDKQLGAAEKQFKSFEAMINSMTPEERSNPDLLAKVGIRGSPRIAKLFHLCGTCLLKTGCLAYATCLLGWATSLCFLMRSKLFGHNNCVQSACSVAASGLRATDAAASHSVRFGPKPYRYNPRHCQCVSVKLLRADRVAAAAHSAQVGSKP